jgi:hypothetical protein
LREPAGPGGEQTPCYREPDAGAPADSRDDGDAARKRFHDRFLSPFNP